MRCMHEASLYRDNCFVTLTYSPENLPAGGTLVLPHFQMFMKRLRKRFGPGIRYYACGEYGEVLQRPHYHALLFNHDFADKRFYGGRNGNSLFTSASLSELWPFGFSVIGDVSFESAGYVARYCMKKVTGKKAEAHYDGRSPEFAVMSRGSKRLGTGGIGRGWYERFKSDVYPLDRVVVRGHPTRPPRFYDDLFAREDRSGSALLKIARERRADRYVDDVLSDGRRVRVSDSDSGRLLVKEVCKKAEVALLSRHTEV